ncbi:MAG: hypothetical protein IMX01_00815 [Limnochordaceae bacterium]|nr:hypothetical protein [Limnochordaceae bacterium]
MTSSRRWLCPVAFLQRAEPGGGMWSSRPPIRVDFLLPSLPGFDHPDSGQRTVDRLFKSSTGALDWTGD